MQRIKCIQDTICRPTRYKFCSVCNANRSHLGLSFLEFIVHNNSVSSFNFIHKVLASKLLAKHESVKPYKGVAKLP